MWNILSIHRLCQLHDGVARCDICRVTQRCIPPMHDAKCCRWKESKNARLCRCDLSQNANKKVYKSRTVDIQCLFLRNQNNCMPTRCRRRTGRPIILKARRCPIAGSCNYFFAYKSHVFFSQCLDDACVWFGIFKQCVEQCLKLAVE